MLNSRGKISFVRHLFGKKTYRLVFSFLLIVGCANGLSAQTQSDYQELVAYNAWANEQILEWLISEPELWDREVTSSFSSIYSTVAHIYAAEYGWLRTVLQQDWEQPEEDLLPMSLANHLKSKSQEWIEAIDEMRDGQFAENRGSYTVAQIIRHVCNHSTYHRGQLITMGRQLGLENPPQTDIVRYLREAQ
ncbi:MAG: DinB family protein [Cyclobacteriaceae bacterium]|nr:DinB family protein [Cyclobacteriaceae bacterium]MCH8517274.1 DinB family protein [Cyclobacteriaceae bacterium]